MCSSRTPAIASSARSPLCPEPNTASRWTPSASTPLPVRARTTCTSATGSPPRPTRAALASPTPSRSTARATSSSPTPTPEPYARSPQPRARRSALRCSPRRCSPLRAPARPGRRQPAAPRTTRSCTPPASRWTDPATCPSPTRAATASSVSPRADRVLEAVAHPGLGDEEARVRRIRLELAADVRQVHAQVVRLGPVFRTPYLAQQRALAHELARVAHEHLHDVPLRRREAPLARRVRHPLGREIDRERVGLDQRRLSGCGCPAA